MLIDHFTSNALPHATPAPQFYDAFIIAANPRLACLRAISSLVQACNCNVLLEASVPGWCKQRHPAFRDAPF